MPFALGIGRVGKQQPDAVSARETPQGGQIRADAVRRKFIDLEVARMHDFSHWRIHRKGVSLRDGMAHRNEMETQAAERQLVFGGHGNEFGPVEKAAFTELVLHERQRHGGAVDFQALDKRNQPRNRSDVVFVPVRKHHAEQPPALSQDGLQRRNDHIHAKLLVIRKHDPAVDKNTPFGRVPHLAVHAYFTQSPQGSNRQKSIRHYALCS